MQSDIFRLDGRNILITGASSGIGRQCAIECSQRGARVILVARNVENLNETRSEMTGEGHIILPLDLSDPARIEDGFDLALSGLECVHGFIHSAGIQLTMAFGQMKTHRFSHLFDVNVLAAFEVTRLITGKKWLPPNGASIVYISSTMGIVGRTGLSGYSATKGSLISAARSLAAELARKKVRVNCISPGFIRTKMMQSYLEMKPDGDSSGNPQRYLLGYGEPEDVARACVFLLSDASRWITGVNLPVDGGYLAN